MQFKIPPTATEGQPYTVSVDTPAQYLTIEIFSPNGKLVIIGQNDNTTSLTIKMKRWGQSLKGICKVRCAAADSSGQEFSEEFDNLQVS